MEDNKKRLYQALIADYDLGDFDTFAKDVEDSTKRKSLYDAISQDYDLGDFDSFTNQLLGSKLSSSDTPMAEKPAVATDNYVQSTPFLSEENKPFAEEHPMGLESQGEIITPFRAEDEKLTTTYQEALSKKGTDLGGPIDMEGTIAKARQTADFAGGVAGEIKAQSGNPFPPKLSATDLDAFKTPEQKAEENYFNRAGDQALYYLQAENQLNAELQAVEEELAALEHDYYQSDEYLRSRMMKSMLQGPARQSWDDFAFAPPRLIELQKRRATLLQAKEHKAVAEELGRNKMEYGTVGEYFSNALTGAKSFAKEKLSSVDPRNRSVEVLADKLSLSRKLTNGETLSSDEQDAWTIYALEDMMEGRYGKAKEDFGYIAGNAAPMMVEFMAELALSPGKGLAKGAMTAAERKAAEMTQKLIRKYGASAVRKNLMRMGTGIYKQGARLTGAAANAAIATHTTQADDLVKGTMERMAGTAMGTADEEGNLVGTGVKDAKDFGQAYYEQAANMTIENLTEAIFEGAGIGKGFKSLLTGTGKKLAGTKVGGKVVGAAAKLADTKTVKAMSELIENTKSSNWYQSVSKLKLAGHLGSIPEEMMEEYAAIPLRHWLGVNDGEQGLWEELTSRQTFYNTAAGLSLGMGAMTAVQVVPPATAMAAGAVWDKYNMFRTHRNLIRRDKEGQNLFGAEWESVKTQIESFTEENFGEGMDALVEEFDSPDKKDAAWRYAQSLQQDRGFNTMRQKAKEEGESDPLADAREEGYEAEDPQQIDAWRAEYDRLHAKWGSQVEEAVAQYGGLNLFFDTFRENPDGETAMREILRYYELKERIEGAEARKADEAETDEEALQSNVARRTNHETGKIVTVNILGDNGQPAIDIATGEPASYYVINGATETGDGNVALSDGMVVLRDADGNRQALPGDKLRLVSVMQPEQIIAEEQARAAQAAAAPVQAAAPEPAVAAGSSADIAAELDKTEEGRGVKEQVDAWFAQGEEPGSVQQLLNSTAGSFAPLGMDYYNALAAESSANAAPAAEPANAAASAESAVGASSASTSRIMRKKGDIDAEASFENGATVQEMADAYAQEYGEEEGLPLRIAQEQLAQIQEEREKTKDLNRKHGSLRKKEKFWSEVVDLLTPKEETVAEEGRQETVGTPVALQYLLEGGKGSIENAGYFFYAIQAAFPHIGVQLQEIRNSMPAEMLGMAPGAFVASNPSQLQEVRRLVEATYGEAGTRILDQMLANSTGFYPREGKALDLEIENLKPVEGNEQTQEAKIVDPATMSDEEKQRRGDMLRNAPVVDVQQGVIRSTPEMSARKAAEKWWDENVNDALMYNTEVGEVEINKNSIESSLAHRYGQRKLDAITSLVEGFENAVYLGTLPDGTRQEGVNNHYFAYPINYNGERCYVFCRAMQDANKNRLYVHEVFVEDRIKKGDTLQTAASQPHGGIALYKDILANVLDAPSEGKGTDKSVTAEGTQEEISENAQNATQSEQNELEKAEKERIDALVPTIEDVADDMQTADEFVAGLFGNGIRITPESFRKETGLGWEEQRRLVGIIAGQEKGGLTVEQAAETIVENYRAELAERGFSGDSMEMRDMVIDILSSGNPRAYAKEAAARRAEQALHREMEAFDRYTQEAFHMSAEEYIMYEESMLPKYIEQYKDFDEQEYYSNFADEQSTQNEHDTTRESAETGGSREILSEEQSSATPGEGTAGEGQQGGTLQGDVQGDAQEGLARAEAGQEVAEKPTEKESRTRFSTSMFEDAERIAREEQRRAPLRRTARAWEKLLGVKVTLMERLEDVKDPVARREIEAAEKKGKKIPGWYSKTEGVFLYLPHVKDVTEVDKTCVHEIVSHKGLKELLGQEKFDELCRKVWGIMSPAARKEYSNYPNVHNELEAADEYIAHLSEKVELNARERSVWQKIMDFIAGLLGRKADNRSKAASIVGNETLSRKDIAELVRLSYAEYLQRNGRESEKSVEGNNVVRFRTLPNERLRKLDEGETCNVERVFTQQKMFNFSSGEKIESYEDVAYIFRNLEDEAVENAFVALVKNGKPTIVHLGMGTATQTTVDQQAVIVAIERINPDAVYFVHNHPSGNLKASRQDALLLDSMKKAYGDIVKDGIIINLRSGKYAVFNEEGIKVEEASPNTPEKEIPAKTYSFSKRVFDKDFNVEELMPVTGSDAVDAYAREHGLVAALTSSQRLGNRGKLSLLVLSPGNRIVGNVFLNHTEVLPGNGGAIGKEIAYYVSAMGGHAGILYGRFDIKSTKHLGGAVNAASAGSVRMLDAISMTEFGGYVSALDEGVMEETPSYGKGETRFRVSNDNQEIFVSNAQRAVEGIKQEKGTPQQWLAMIEKNGGLKAGEDKWLGLSDWLKGLDKKSVTKDEILDFIGENKIRIEEVTYGEEAGGYSEEKLDELNAEYEELIWEGEEETGSIYANDWADYAYESMVARYGDDFRNAFDTEGIGTGSRLVPHYYYDGSLSEEAKQFVGEEGANDNEINSTRLEYTTEGLDNKQEIALTVPTIEPWNQSDDTHFGDAGGGRAVAWIRFGEANDADGNSVLVIDEIQSKRHQEGREKGYNNPRVIQILDRMNEIQKDLYSPYGVSEEVHAEKKALQEELEAAFESENPQMKKVAEHIKEKEARLSELNREKAEKENDETVEMLKLQDRQLETRNVREYDYYEQEINNIREAQERRDDEIDELRSSIRNLNEEYSHYYNSGLRNARIGVMPAPFEKNWHELAMKRMLRYAAENGFDKVAWTTGAQQAERYNLGKYFSDIEREDNPSIEGRRFVLHGGNVEALHVDESGNVIESTIEEAIGKPLVDVVGKSMADRMMSMDNGDMIEGEDLRIGGEGMKGFYDKMLPSFVQKYTKKWGAKVGEVELPHLEEGAQKMWSVDVTPEMKESVMEGQTMFRVTDDSPADAIRRAYDGEMRTARFLTKETMVDYLASVKALLDTIAKKTGNGITDPQNVYRAMLTLTNKNTQELAAFDYGVLTHLTKAIAGILGKEWNGDWDAPEAATLQRYAKVKHGIERDRDMAVRRAIPRMAEQKYREQFGELDRMIAAETDAEALEALRTKKATMLADPKAYGMQTADEIAEQMEQQWYARIAEIRRGEGTWREKQQRMDAAIADVFDLDAEGLENYGLTLTEDYSGMTETLIAEGETDRKTARKNKGAVRAAAYDFVEQYEERTGADKTDALWDGVRAVSDFSLEKQRRTGLVDAKYVEDCNRRYEFYVPLRNFAETTADEVYDYLDETYNDNNPVKTARGRRSEAGNPFSNVMMLGYQSITAGNKNAAVQHFWNLASRADVKGFLVPSRPWRLAELDDAQREEVNEKLGGIADTTGDVILPRIPENATAQQVQDIISNFEDVMKDLKKRGLAFQGKKRARQEYRLTSRQQENAHRVKVYVNGEARYVTIVGDPRAALALNGKLNPESGVPEKYKAMQQFLSGAFTSQNPSFALANIIRDTQHANMRAFITESGRYWAKFSAKQAAMMKPGRLAFLLAKYENSMGNTGRHGWGGELDMRNETHRNFKRFMELGGATGYTFSHKEIENLKKLADMAERAEGKTPKGQGYVVGEIFDFIRLCSESAELINRFAAFEASLEMGRSEQRAISDAQEITLNFSRKGAGKKTYNPDRKGKTWLESRKYNAVNAIAGLSQFGRDHIIFWNATIQGSYQTYKMFREHTAKTTFALVGVPIALSVFALPALNAMICAFMGDDEDAYYDELPDYVRQRNLCIKNPFGKGWLKIPLDPATQKVWAAGDAIGAAWRGKRQIDYWGDLGANAVGLFSPVDIYWGDRNDNLSERALSAATSFTPTLIQPLLHSYANRDWKGKPLYNDSRYIDQLPSYAKSFKSDKESLKALSKFLNDVGNSDADSYGRTWHDFAPPGVMEELLYGYTGGYGQLALAAVEGAIAVVSDEAKGNFRWDNMPVVNRLWVEGDPGQTRLNIYRNYRDTAVDFMENVEQRRSQINREYKEAKRSHDTFAEAEALAKMKQLYDGDYQRYEILNNSDKLFQKYMKGSRIEDVPDFVIKGMLEAIEIVNHPDGEKEEKKSENDK